jgi:hypothetical protein
VWQLALNIELAGHPIVAFDVHFNRDFPDARTASVTTGVFRNQSAAGRFLSASARGDQFKLDAESFFFLVDVLSLVRGR